MNPRDGTYTPEGGGWLVGRCPVPELAGRGAVDLLALGSELPGNLRYVRDRHNVVLAGEVRLGASITEARARLGGLLAGAAAGADTTTEALEAALEASGLAWSRREKAWAVPASERIPRELVVRTIPGGARVEAVLIEWDVLAPAEEAALADFLLAAQTGLRGARCELGERTARAVCVLETAHVETDLVHGLSSVAVACRLLMRAAAALLTPEVAHAFLEFQKPLAA
jgi:hypothetical protein